MDYLLLFIGLAILFVGAKLLGELFRRIKQPALGGELLAGIIIGPTILNFVQPNDDIELFSIIAIFFVMLFIGLQMDLREIKKMGRSALIISVLSLIIPFFIGYQLSIFFNVEFVASLFIGLLLSVTSVPVSAMILLELGILKNKIGTTVISVAVIDDIISLVILTVILQLHGNEGTSLDFIEFGFSMILMISYLVGILLLAFFVYKINYWIPYKFNSFFTKPKIRESMFGVLIIVAILLSLGANYTGIHFILGAFFAGLIFSEKILGREKPDRSYGIISGITFGFFAPLFFAIIGMKFSGQSLENSIPFLILLVGLGIGGKTLGGFIGTRICKFSKNDSIVIATLLNGRGTVGLAITALVYSIGLLDITLFSICISVCFITTVITPLISKPLLKKTTEFEESNRK